MKKILAIALSCVFVFLLSVTAAAEEFSYTVADLTNQDLCNVDVTYQEQQYNYVLNYDSAAKTLNLLYRESRNSPELDGFISKLSVSLADAVSFKLSCDSNWVTIDLKNETVQYLTDHFIKADPASYPGCTVTIANVYDSTVVPTSSEVTPTEGATDVIPSEGATDVIPSEGDTGVTPSEVETDVAPSVEDTTDTAVLPVEDTTADASDPEKQTGTSDDNGKIWKLAAIIGCVLALLFAAAAVVFLLNARKKTQELIGLKKELADMKVENQALKQNVNAAAAEVQKLRRMQEPVRPAAPVSVTPPQPIRNVPFMEKAREVIKVSYQTGTRFSFSHKYVQMDEAESMMNNVPLFRESATEKTHFIVFGDPETQKLYLLPNPVFYSERNCMFELSKGEMGKCIAVVGAEKQGKIAECTPSEVETDSSGMYRLVKRGRIVWR
jgi:hypothetical protein